MARSWCIHTANASSSSRYGRGPRCQGRTATIHVRTKTSVGAKMCECAQFPRLVPCEMRYGCRRAGARSQASASTAVPATSDRPCVLPGGLQASCVFGHRLRQQASRLSDGCWLMVVSCWLLDVGCWCRSHRRRHYSSPRPRLHRCRHW